MAVEVTPLGFQKPDGNERVRDMDDVIRHNAGKSQEYLGQLIPAVNALRTLAGFESGDLSDAAVSLLVSNPDSATSIALDARYLLPTTLDRVDNTPDLEKPVSQAQQEALDAKAPLVRTFEQLRDALLVGGSIRVTDAPITVTDALMVMKPTRILGGNFVLPADANYAAFRVRSSDVTFSGSVFTGPGTANHSYVAAARFINANGLPEEYLRNVNLLNVKMEGCQSDNVRYEFIRDSVIAMCNMTNYLYSGIMLLSCEDTLVIANTVTNAVMKGTVVNVYGIAASDSRNTVALRSRRINIIGNTVRNIPWEGIDTHGGDTIIIIGNTVVNCVRGIALVVGNDNRLIVPVNCIVKGNYVDKGTAGGAEREGISLFGLSGNLADATIIGNTVRGYSASNALFFSQHVNHQKTLVEGNSHPHIPWTNLAMTNTAQWTSHASFPLQYMVEGRHVYLRGFATSVTSTQADTTITQLPDICKVDRSIVFAAASHGSNSAAGTGTLGITSAALLRMMYRTGADFYSYPIECSYIRAFG